MKQLLLLFTGLIYLSSFSQISDFKIKFDLPNEVAETSGLLFLNGKIITHNDSGDSANLYEIDSLTGNLTRTIIISNATNIDWEDLSEDDTHIYIGDIGNNSGNRIDLKIYKILKTDYLTENAITAEVINFSYEDQTDFTTKVNANNFDAEAFVIYQDSILIFTKNWTNFKTNVYKIPKVAGTYSAEKISTGNVQLLITGATYNLTDDIFFLCGYDSTANPFLVFIDNNRTSGSNIFDSGYQRISIASEIGQDAQGSQVEGITNFGNGKYYLSREFVSTIQGGVTFNFPQRLYEFSDSQSNTLVAVKEEDSIDFKIYPNPVNSKIYIKKTNSELPLFKVKIFSVIGKEINKTEIIDYSKGIDISHLKNGTYFIRFYFKDRQTITKRFVKF